MDRLQNFRCFGKFGLNPLTVYPCYGLAEGTLFVSGEIPGTGAFIKNFKIDNYLAISSKSGKSQLSAPVPINVPTASAAVRKVAVTS